MSNNLIGQHLGEYELREILGAGGMGTVYRAYHRNLKREVAVKVINLGANDSELRARFIREAETAARLEDSHIVRLYHFGVERDINYIVMQYLTGGSLSERMKQAADSGRPKASLREVSRLLDQLASALDYAHRQGVVHRDIKPQNVMFDNQGAAFIVDFGIAKLLTGATNMTGTGFALGTPSYMSPEQWASKDVSAASDQYALAVMMYQLVAGRLPFEADTPLQVMYKHMNDLPTPLSTFRPGVPADLLLVMGRAMAKDPAERFPNCTQFAMAFASAISGAPDDNTGYFTFKLAQSESVPVSAPAAPAPVTPPTLKPTAEAAGVPSMPNIPVGRRSDVPPPKALHGPFSASSTILGVVAMGVVALTVIAIAAIAIISELRETPVAELTDTPAPGIVVIPTDTPEPTATDTPPPTLNARQIAGATREAMLTATVEADSIAAELTALFFEDLTVTATLFTPTHTPSMTPTDMPTRTPVPTDTATLTLTPSETSTRRPTRTPSPTLTSTSTSTLRPTRTPTPTNTATSTQEPTSSAANVSVWQPVEQDFGGVAMLLVPAGCFMMGSEDVGPVHEQCFEREFWIDKTEVTQGQFRENGGTKSNGNRFVGVNRPVEQITWHEAGAYCQRRGGRLPTEAEWEYAARGPENRLYPWGDEPNAGYGVHSGNANGQTTRVGTRAWAASWVGAVDMAGNVWEWTSSLFTSYPYDAADGRESAEATGMRVIRGGSWLSPANFMQGAVRSRNGADVSSSGIGFRCVHDSVTLSANGGTLFAISQGTASFTVYRDTVNGRTEITGTTDDVGGDLTMHFTNPRASSVGVITVGMRALATDNEFLNRAIREIVLETDRHAVVTFRPSVIRGLPARVQIGNTYRFVMDGYLQIRNVTREITWDVSVKVVTMSRLEGSATARITRGQYSLSMPDVPSAANIADELALRIDFVAVPR